MKFFRNIFGKSVEKFKFRRNLNIATGNLYEGLRVFIIISGCINPRMRKFSGTKCRENKKKKIFHRIFLFFFFSKIVPFMK